MRLTGGTWRGRPIKTVPGGSTRPTASRVREALFNILQGTVEGAVFVDLFCGAGTVGLEALSRGAAHAVFVESARKPQRLLAENLERLHVSRDRVTIAEESALTWARDGQRAGDLIFCDPPYRTPLLAQVLPALAARDGVAPGGWLVAETARETDLGVIALPGLEAEGTRHYGDTALWLWHRPESGSPPETPA